MPRMRKLSLIAMRNVFRNKRRSLLTLSILSLGSVGLILVGGFFNSLIEGLGEVFIHSQTGHIQINARGYNDKGAAHPFNYLIRDVSKIQSTVEKDPDVRFTVPRLKFQGLASSEDTTIAVIALGVDPEREHRLGSFQSGQNHSSTNIVEGQDLDPDDPLGAILGSGLMNALGLKVGDPVTLLTTRQAGAMDGAVYHVRGVFETFIKDFDDRAMKVGLQGAQKLLGIPDQVHSLLVVLAETRATDAVNARLKDLLKDNPKPLELFTWEELGQYYRQSKTLAQKIYSTVQVIITVIFFFSIANTINMAVFERMREFGTMMALGNERLIIFFMIFMEAMILGLVGSSAGLLLGGGLAHVVSAIGIPIRPPQAASDYITAIALHPMLLLQTFLITVVSSLLSSLIPGYRASHFSIIHALGYV